MPEMEKGNSMLSRPTELLDVFRKNWKFAALVLLVLLSSVAYLVRTERTDYVKNGRGWRLITSYKRWQATLSEPSQKIKVVIPLPEKLEVWQRGRVVTQEFDESAYDKARLEFWASGKSSGAYSLSVQLNGQEVKRYPRGMGGNARWHAIPLEPRLREAIKERGEAEIVFTLDGAPNPETDYVVFYGDGAVDSRNSFFFEGANWTQDDLSIQPGSQQGEFYVRLAYSRGIFTAPSWTTERIVLPLFGLSVLCLLVAFRQPLNAQVSRILSPLVHAFKANRALVTWLILIFLLALGLRVYYILYGPPLIPLPDAWRYDTQARNVVSGYGLSESPPEPFPQFYGYPLLLAFFYTVFGHSWQAVYLLQALFGALTCVFVSLIAYHSFDRSRYIALAAMLLAAFFPPFIFYSGQLLTETFATFILSLFTYLFILALRVPHKRAVLLSGMLFGLMVLFRLQFFYLVVFVLATAVIVLWPSRKGALRFVSLFLLGAVLTFSSLLARNAHLFDSFALDSRIGLKSLSDAFLFLSDPGYSQSGDLYAFCREHPEECEEAFGQDVGETLQRGFSHMGETFFSRPFGYLSEYIQYGRLKMEALWYRGSSTGRMWLLGIGHRDLWAFRRSIVFFSMIGLVVCVSRWRKYLPLYALIIYPSLLHFIFLPNARHSIPWMPYVCIFAAAGMGALVTIVRRTGSKSLALVLTALIALTVSTIGVEEPSFLALFGPLTSEGLLVIELCFIVLTCFLLFRHRKKIPEAMISASAVVIAFGYMSLRGQALPLPSEETFSILMDAHHYVGHLIDLPGWAWGYDHYYLKMKLDGAQTEPPQKKYGVRVFANGEMIKEYPISNEGIHGWERIPIDKRFIEGQEKLYVSLQVFGAPDVFENYLGVFIQRDQDYGISVFNDSTRYLSIDRDEEQDGTFLIGLEMTGEGVYRDVDLWLGSRLGQAEKLALLSDESGKWYRLGEEIALVGYDVADTVKAGEVLRPRLYWQARAKMDEDYTVFVHLLDGEGDVRVQQDCLPQRGDYPTSEWRPGEVVWDAHELYIPPDLAAGSYQLVAGMYLLKTMERLPVLGARGERWLHDMIPLGEVWVQ
jgi:4-amino-4-deoxy-L-arabinose transferase-like glycosyltransferase